MDRRRLILRRFDALSIGLGAYENGTWVDHTVLADAGAVFSSPADRAALDALHAWFDCCAAPAVAAEESAQAAFV